MTLSHRLYIGAQLSLVLAFFAFPISVALANLSLVLTLLLWISAMGHQAARTDLGQAMRNPLVMPALALFAWIVIAMAWSPADRGEMGGFIQKYLKFALVPVVLALLQDATVRRRSWNAFSLAMLLTLCLTWLNVWFDFPFTRTRNQGFGTDHTVIKDYISQGIMMSFFAAMCAYLALKMRPEKWAWTGWIGWTLASISILFLSLGRTGYLAWAMSTALFFTTLALARSRRMAIAALAGVLTVLAVIFAASPAIQERTEVAFREATSSNTEQVTSIEQVTSVGARVQMARFVLDSAPDALIAGHGTASYPVLAANHFNPVYCAVVCPHPHNQFSFFLFEQGAIGLALFLWFIATIVRSSWQQDPERRALGLALVGVMCAACMTHSSLWLSTESHFLILISVLAMASLQARRDRHRYP